MFFVLIAQMMMIDGCVTYDDCVDGLACVDEVCVKPVGLCGFCWKSFECGPGYVCLGYDGIGGMCLPKGCSNVDVCPEGMTCNWMGLPSAACWVQPAGSECVGDVLWKANTCGMLYMPFIDCAGAGKVCFDGSCCIRDCMEAECGSDGCGDSCGMCGFGSACIDGQCTECIPGVIDYDQCDHMCSARMRVCTPDGVWGPQGDCESNVLCVQAQVRYPMSCDIVDCHPGDTIDESCELCGNRTVVCDESCQWEEGRCLSQGSCMPRSSRACDDGVQYCMSSCRWGVCISDTHDPAPVELVSDERDGVVALMDDRMLNTTQFEVRQSCGCTPFSSSSWPVLFVLSVLVFIRTRP